jgi:hypothetical protein
MFIQQGKTNWIFIIIVALVAGAIGGGLIVYINDTIKQTESLSQADELKKTEITPKKPNTPIASDFCAGEGVACGQLSTECNCGPGCDCIVPPIDCCAGLHCQGYDINKYPSVGKCVKNDKIPSCDQACKDIGYVSGRVDEHTDAEGSGGSYCIDNKEVYYPGLKSSWIDWTNVSTGLKLCCCLPGAVKTSSSSDFNLVFKYGVGGVNVLDTFTNKFTKDMIAAPSITVDFKLTQAEKASVRQKINELGLLNRASEIKTGTDTNVAITPCSNYYLKVQDGALLKEISWDDCSGQIIQAYRKFSDFMINLIESKKEFKDLPEVQGGYD